MAAGTANANTLTYLGLDGNIGVSNIGGIGYNGGVYTGKLLFNESSLGNIETMCADTVNVFPPPTSWNDTLFNTNTYSPNIALAGNIVALDFNSAVSTDQQVGLQTAIWEAVYDGVTDGAVTFATFSADLTAGNFTSNISGAALADAYTYFQDRTIAGNAIFIKAGVGPDGSPGQDQITPVPEPASMAALAVGAVALLRRRKSTK